MPATSPEGPISARERYTGLLYASLLADSLSLPAHWNYEAGDIAASLGRVTELGPPPAGGYHPGKGAGDFTHLGDQAFLLLESIEACNGNFSLEDFARRWRDYWPQSQSYRDKATKATLAHFDEGKPVSRAGSDSIELAGAARVAPLLVALRGEEPTVIIGAARAQTALTHNNPEVLDTAEFIARTVFLLVRGVSVTSALSMAASLTYRALPAEAYLRKAEETRDLSTADAVDALGQTCLNDRALPSLFALLLRHGDNLENALIENVMVGGDSAARGLVMGIFLGAAYGRRALPERWVQGLKVRVQVEQFLRTVGL